MNATASRPPDLRYSKLHFILKFANDYSESKWQVPLTMNPVQRTSDFDPECKSKGLLPTEWALAHEKAKAYISSLTAHNE